MKKAALILSGGAALGAAHIGALRVLERKFEFDFLAGVSAGAIVAAAIACGKTAQEISDTLYAQNFWHLAFDISFSGNQFEVVRGEKILNLLREFSGNRRFSDLKKEKKQLFIGATDFQNGEPVLLKTGSIAEAVRASISIPAIFEPVYHQKKWLVDGFLSQNLPLSVALEKYTGDTILAIDVANTFSRKIDFSHRKPFGRIRNFRNTTDRVMRIMFKNQQHFPPDPRVRTIRPDLGAYVTSSIRKLREIEAEGEKAARKMFGPAR